ncbi:MAG: xerC [Blastococcus sp.]|nr:xerC [Blastococcus sp.]
MASIARRPDGTYRPRYRDEQGREHARHFKRKVDAQRWLDEVTAAVQTGTYVDPKRARLTVGELAPLWLAGKINVKPTTHARYADVLRTHVLPRWGDVALIRVTHGDVQGWLSTLSARGLSGASVRKAQGVLSGILGLAVRDKRLAVNPALGVALPPMQEKRRRYLAAEQLEALADAAGPGRVAVLTLGYCGLRWSELAALRVRHFDLLRRRVLVEEAVTEVDGTRLVWGTPKTHGRRSVPLPRFLADELARTVVNRPPDELAFPSPQGAVLRNRNARAAWFDAAARAVGEPGLTPHELRHTAASLAIKAGANVKAVQRMLGHASAAMTLDRYADLFDDDLDDVADRLDALRAASCGKVADFLRTEALQRRSGEPSTGAKSQVRTGVEGVETRGIEPLTPALQRRCSAN